MTQSTAGASPLYEPGPGDQLRLRLGHCAGCGAVSFPPSPYGCRRCGAAADRIEVKLTDGSARLRRCITLHAPVTPGVVTPCVVGEIEIAPGIRQEAVIAAAEEDLKPGMLLQAHVAQGRGEAVHCEFRPCQEAA